MAVDKHHIIHKKAPLRWQDGFPLGNGAIGVMVWGDGNPLAFTLDKADLWDLRCNTDYMRRPDFNYEGLQRLVAEQRFSEIDEIFEERQRRDNPIAPTKISIGRAELCLGETSQYECRLELSAATVEGIIQCSAGEHRVESFVHHDMNVFCLHVSPCPSDARMVLVPLADMNKSLAELNYPARGIHEDGDIRIMLQQIPAGPTYAVAWNDCGPEFFLSVQTGDSHEEAIAKARATWRRCSARGFDKLHEEHKHAWNAFWSGSAVYLPEQRMELLWYYGLYLLASSARRGSTPPGLQGLWAMDGVMPPWRGDYHADMNVQEIFWPACASGHLDLLDCWCGLMRDCTEQAQEFTRRFFGAEGAFWTCAFLPGYTIVPGWHTVQFAWSSSGWLGWLVWLRWRYSMDVEWLRETGYPLVADIFKFYRANLKREADGRLHIPLSTSPEYKENKPAAWCKDPNIDIAFIRRCCDWLIEMEQALGRDDLSSAAREVHDQLVSYHLTENKELCLWEGRPLDESHRHPSHLMPIHPAMDLTVDDDEDTRTIINASLEQYFSLGQYLWAGHTYAQLISFAAVVGRAGWAYNCLSEFIDHWVAPNGLHFNRDLWSAGVSAYHVSPGEFGPFTMEANCGVSAGISDMLVQGWSDVVRIFPAVPEHWRDIAFRDLLTEGAFRVSAIRQGGRTVWVKVRAGVDRLLRLRNPFGEEDVKSTGPPLRRDGGFLVAQMKKEEELVIHPCTEWSECVAGQSIDFEKAIGIVKSSDTTRLGLR